MGSFTRARKVSGNIVGESGVLFLKYASAILDRASPLPDAERARDIYSGTKA